MKIESRFAEGLLSALGGVLVLLCATSAHSQTAAPSAPLPADPKELLAQAARLNGLHGDDLKPWHIKVSFQSLDGKNKIVDESSAEEWWTSANQYKIIWESKDFHQVVYGTPQGEFVTGARGVETPALREALAVVMDPIASTNAEYRDWPWTTIPDKPGMPVHCVGVHAMMYCFDTKLPALRMWIGDPKSLQEYFDNLVRFQGRYISKKITTQVGSPNSDWGKPRTVFLRNVELLESIPAVDVAFFTPPADAKPRLLHPARITVDDATFNKQILRQTRRVFPPIALAAHVQGIVVVKVVVGVDGLILDKVKVLSGEPMLQQAAIECVKQWTFKPYLVSGEPVEMEKNVLVDFSIQPSDIRN